MNIRFGTEIAAAAAAHHLDPRLLAAVAAQETGGPGANSGKNIVGDGGHGHGIFQIDDRFWAFARSAAAMDPAKNAAMAASILSENLRRFGGNVRQALSAYNAGSPRATGTITRWADGRSLGYADSVLRHYHALGGSFAQIAADTRAASSCLDPLRRAAERAARPGHVSQLPQRNFAASFVQVQPAAPTQPIASWTQLTTSSSRETETADRALADLVDTGDLFENASDDA